jgi:hypothetical protein
LRAASQAAKILAAPIENGYGRAHGLGVEKMMGNYDPNYVGDKDSNRRPSWERWLYWWLGLTSMLGVAALIFCGSFVSVDVNGIAIFTPSIALLGAALCRVKWHWEKDDLSLAQKLSVTLRIAVLVAILLPVVLYCSLIVWCTLTGYRRGL